MRRQVAITAAVLLSTILNPGTPGIASESHSLAPHGSIASAISGKRILVGYTIDKASNDSLEHGPEIFCGVLKEKLAATCVNIFMGEGKRQLVSVGIQPRTMREAWDRFALEGEASELYSRGSRRLNVDFTLRKRASMVGPTFLNFYWESWASIDLYDAAVPGRLLAEIDAVGGAWAWQSEKAWRKAHRRAALDLVEKLRNTSLETELSQRDAAKE